MTRTRVVRATDRDPQGWASGECVGCVWLRVNGPWDWWIKRLPSPQEARKAAAAINSLPEQQREQEFKLLPFQLFEAWDE